MTTIIILLSSSRLKMRTPRGVQDSGQERKPLTAPEIADRDSSTERALIRTYNKGRIEGRGSPL
jgi:hypothetical protein